MSSLSRPLSSMSLLLLPLLVLFPPYISARPNCSPAYGVPSPENCGLAIDSIATTLPSDQPLDKRILFVRNAALWQDKLWRPYPAVQLDKTWTYGDCAVTLSFNNLHPPPLEFNSPNAIMGGKKAQKVQTETWSTVIDGARQVLSNCTEEKRSGGRVILGSQRELSLSIVSSPAPNIASQYDTSFTQCFSNAKNELPGASRDATLHAFNYLKLIVEDQDSPEPGLPDTPKQIPIPNEKFFPDKRAEIERKQFVRVCKSDEDCVAKCGMKCVGRTEVEWMDAYGGRGFHEVGACDVARDGVAAAVIPNGGVLAVSNQGTNQEAATSPGIGISNS